MRSPILDYGVYAMYPKNRETNHPIWGLTAIKCRDNIVSFDPDCRVIYYRNCDDEVEPIGIIKDGKIIHFKHKLNFLYRLLCDIAEKRIINYVEISSQKCDNEEMPKPKRPVGRPKTTVKQREQAKKLYRKGLTYVQIANIVLKNSDRQRIYKWIKKLA